MPELPDVEIFRRYFQKKVLEKKVKEVEVKNAKILKTKKKTFQKTLEGGRFKDCTRHGKYMLAGLDRAVLIMHFGMTGYLKYYEKREYAPKHLKADFTLSNTHHMGYVSKRMLGWLDLAEDAEEFIEKNNLGPDAYKIKKGEFINILINRRGYIKSALMNQKNLAGLGNVYSDEMLFASGVHPKTSVNKLSEEELGRLHRNMQKILKKAVEAEADPKRMPERYLINHRKKGAKCPEDNTKIYAVKINQRTSYFCPKHQEKGGGGR